MPRFITAFGVLALLIMALFACKNTHKKPVKDKEYQKYLTYKHIFEGYGVVPPDSSQAAIEDFLKSFPNDARAWVFYGRILYNQQKPAQAINAYRTAIGQNPRYSTAYSGMGAMFNLLGQHDSAEFYLLKAAELRDSSAYTYVNLAMVYMHKNVKDKSFAFADTSLAMADSLAPVYACLSKVYYHFNNKPKSDSMYTRAVNLGLKDTASFNLVLLGKMPMEDYFKKNNY